MNCEMCGTESSLTHAMVEGVELRLCKNCLSFGKIVNRPRAKLPPRPKQPEKEMIEVIVSDYSNLIREKREKMGLKQMEIAKFLSEKESLIHKMEGGTYVPSIELAKKLEKQLGIKLIEEVESTPQNLKASATSYTIGDMIKIK
ncbi:MAG: multiprotein bridging factor aMBF1 [archaeon]